MRDNPITDVFFESFTTPESLGKKKIELIPGGSAVQVTDENKSEYLSLLLEYISNLSIAEPLAEFLDGFFFVIPQEIIGVLNADELELMVCGIPFIDLQEWQDFTEYRGEFSKNHAVVMWFWEILSQFTQEYLSQLILFVTGTPRLPVEGFASLRTARGDPARFTMEPSPYSQGILPRAHTCFNRLDLPVYPSKEALQKALIYVLDNHAVGFGIE
ncbi:hypothetical protein SteCoe_36680 [Stentor coeruleus]|uniref:HECT-type E3 ubiquitin transferase n=1 Tax=Stentor coeruleus TaxID=5963 RepID=A0A1R2API8_9CILI|nr:hypothetical protein SteCoe_36680 [Stentor coeruleus]